MGIDPRSVLPPAMAAAVAADEASEANSAQLEQFRAADEAVMAARMADHAERASVAATGYTPAELRQAAQARVDALAVIGWDASAPQQSLDRGPGDADPEFL